MSTVISNDPMVIVDNLLSHADNSNYNASDNKSPAPENVENKTVSINTKSGYASIKSDTVFNTLKVSQISVLPVIIVEFTDSNFTTGIR